MTWSLAREPTREFPQDLESTLGLNILAEAAGEGALAPTELVIDTGVADGIRTPRFSELSIGFVKVSPPIQRSEPSASGRAPASSTATGPLPAFPGHRREGVRRPCFDEVRRAAAQRHRARRPHFRLASRCSQVVGRRVESTSSTSPTARSPGSFLACCCSPMSSYCVRFRSLVLPLKAILLNLLSIAAAY